MLKHDFGQIDKLPFKETQQTVTVWPQHLHNGVTGWPQHLHNGVTGWTQQHLPYGVTG